MLQHPGQQPFCGERDTLAFPIFRLHFHPGCPRHIRDNARDGQAALRADLFTFARDDLGIDEDVQALLHLGEEDSFAHADLRGRQTNPAGVAHHADHALDEPVDLRGETPDGSGLAA